MRLFLLISKKQQPRLAMFSAAAITAIATFGTKHKPTLLLGTSAFFMKQPSRVPGYRPPSDDVGSILNNPLISMFLSSSTSRPSMAERVLEKPAWPDSWPYNDEVDFKRMDESEDTYFYNQPRLVYHIDDPCVNALTQYYSETIRDDDDVLDLCSSWVSHYPRTFNDIKTIEQDGKQHRKVVGIGMNEYELSNNKQLTSYVVKDLNNDPKLPFEDASFDVVTCVVSVDYLNKPLQVFQEIGRVLRPGGKCIISISNRCFPTKAFQIWLQTSDMEHIFMVGSFFHYTNMFEPPKCYDRSPNPGRSDPLYIIQALRRSA